MNHFKGALKKDSSSIGMVLVSTDLLSRGIDVKDIDVVINYQNSKDFHTHIHRIGRTARSENKGTVYTFIHKSEH